MRLRLQDTAGTIFGDCIDRA